MKQNETHTRQNLEKAAANDDAPATDDIAANDDAAAKPNHLPSRRAFLGSAASLALCTASADASAATQVKTATTSTFLDLVRPPDRVTAFAGLNHRIALARTSGAWQGSGVEVHTTAETSALTVRLLAPAVALTHLHLRWTLPITASMLFLGDAWERSYGELAWQHLIPERVMPWYFATHDGATCHAYGVKTGAGSLCFWQTDAEGISLWLNVSNGGNGVQLGQRELLAATVVARKGQPGEDAFSAIHSFCRQLCTRPALSFAPLYGTNDWYYAYGKNTAQGILRDTDLVASLSQGLAVRPFSVIDAGWESGPPTFPDMAKLAADISAKQVRPGIWMRPLKAEPNDAPNLLLPANRFAAAADAKENPALDPTIPEAQALIRSRVQRLTGWGYELIKHDFSTYDLLGQWGFQMGPSPTLPGWNLNDRSRTNAEVLLDLYALLREAAGHETVLLGCNTVGHLAQGLFEAQRTGDDTSGKLWERTRRMGVNTLAYRLPQHKAFFVQDADCVGLTRAIPWELNQQWLDLLARSGTALFISPEPDAIGPQQKQAIQQAFARIASGTAASRPLDWLTSTVPEVWSGSANTAPDRTQYRWCEPDGADAFHV